MFVPDCLHNLSVAPTHLDDSGGQVAPAELDFPRSRERRDGQRVPEVTGVRVLMDRQVTAYVTTIEELPGLALYFHATCRRQSLRLLLPI